MISFTKLADTLSVLARLNRKTIEWREQFINKRPANMKPLLPETTVYLVDGTAIRNLVDSDYIQGGNGWRYSWIPKNEVWIDDTIPESERDEVLLHESDEISHMAKGENYEDAHDHAKSVEDKLRHSEVPPGELEPVTK